MFGLDCFIVTNWKRSTNGENRARSFVLYYRETHNQMDLITTNGFQLLSLYLHTQKSIARIKNKLFTDAWIKLQLKYLWEEYVGFYMRVPPLSLFLVYSLQI